MAAIKDLSIEADEIATKVAALGKRLHALTDTLSQTGMNTDALREVADTLDQAAQMICDELDLDADEVFQVVTPDYAFCIFEDCDQHQYGGEVYCAEHLAQKKEIAAAGAP
jgi:hypothetical protein